MDRKLRDEWVAALRSGEYKQGQTWLRSVDEEYCCLGVLCALPSTLSGPVAPVARDALEDRAFLTDSILLWARLPEETAWKLAALNDKPKPFIEIADWIEANIPVE